MGIIGRAPLPALGGLLAGLTAGGGRALAAGLPQLDPDTFATQIFWLIVSFAVLYLLMARVALPRVGQVLEERQERIDENLERAKALKAEAAEAAEAYQVSLAAARGRAQAAIRETRDAMAAEASARHGELGARLASDIKGAEERIAAAKTEALAGIRDVAVEVAADMTDKLAGRKMTKRVVGAAVDAILKERR